MKVTIFLFTAFVFLQGCQKNEGTVNANETHDSPHQTLDQQKLAEIIGQRMDLRSGEKVLMVAKPGAFNQLVTHLEKIVKASGATYLGTLSVDGSAPESWRTEFTKQVLAGSEDDIKDIFKTIDLGIMLPGATPQDLPYKILQDQLNEGLGRTIHFHWAGAYDLNGNLLTLDSDKEHFYLQVLQDTDYQKLASDQRTFEAAMRDQTIRVTTPSGTDISFSIGDRPVTKQDGNASLAHMSNAQNLIDREVELPAGAIRVAPIEETVQGTVAFPDATWEGTLVRDLKLIFENGVAIDITAGEGQEGLLRTMDSVGISARSFREFALGMNPLMEIQREGVPWIPYYGYGAGVVRLSLGDNKELGGNVGGGYVRWNFFPDATVYVGDSLWVQDGKLIK